MVTSARSAAILLHRTLTDLPRKDAALPTSLPAFALEAIDRFAFRWSGDMNEIETIGRPAFWKSSQADFPEDLSSRSNVKGNKVKDAISGVPYDKE